MAKLLQVLCLVPLVALTYAANLQDCGSQAKVNLNDITVTGCDATTASCTFQKGRMASITLPFTPTFESSNVKAEVYGVIGGVPIPFPLNNPNACSESGLTCPIQAGQSYTYTASLPVKRIYPSISLNVKWELKDNGKTLVCILIPVQLR